MFKRSYINKIPVEEAEALANLGWFVMGGGGGGGGGWESMLLRHPYHKFSSAILIHIHCSI